VPIALALMHHQYMMTMVLFGVAAVSDAADGFIAKRFGWQTSLGAALDPAADKLLLATVFVTLAVLRLIPLWLMAAALARDIIIVAGAVAYRVFYGPIEVRPSMASKLNTLCQVAFILAIIGREEFSRPPAAIVLLLGAVTFVTIVVSGIDYVFRYGRRALQEAKSRRPVGRAAGSKLT